MGACLSLVLGTKFDLLDIGVWRKLCTRTSLDERAIELYVCARHRVARNMTNLNESSKTRLKKEGCVNGYIFLRNCNAMHITEKACTTPASQ